MCALYKLDPSHGEDSVEPAMTGHFDTTFLTTARRRIGGFMGKISVIKTKTVKIVAIMVAFCISMTIAAATQTVATITNFDLTNGNSPNGPLVQGPNGNLYGTTALGGNSSGCDAQYGCGTVFEIAPDGTLTTLYSFCSQAGCVDGRSPVSGLLLASNGNFYGMTSLKGANQNGTVFEITPDGSLTTLYSFCAQANCTDGKGPVGALIQASNGNLYGVTEYGGSATHCRLGCGTIFQITPAGQFGTVFTFCLTTECTTDGRNPEAGLLQAANGNFYGTTTAGGKNGDEGTIFEFTASGTLKTLYSFCALSGCADGYTPLAALIQARNRNLYGTTPYGGAHEGGTVFQITPGGTFSTLYSFCAVSTNGGTCPEGATPLSQLTQATDGRLYGTTWAGGTNDDGTAYRISPAGVEKTLYSFCSQTDCADGLLPNPALMQATNGTLYGVTVQGGSDLNGCNEDDGGCGTIFSLSLGLGPFVETNPKSATVGTTISILGNNLTGTTNVSFNGVAAAFSVVSDNYITASVPAGATTGLIEVTIPSGTLSSNVAFLVQKQ
jgi:uncharacterized repeat protein (TIGR03803 family)